MRFALLVFLVGLTSTVARAQDPFDDTVVRQIKLTFSQSDWWSQLIQNRPSGTYLEGDLEVDGATYPSVGVRFKGFSSYHFSRGRKKPFKIKLDAFVPGQEIEGYDAIRLNNCWSDPSFIREPLMYWAVRQYAPGTRCGFSVLTINDEVFGVYVTDQQKDRRYMDDWYEEERGNRYKMINRGEALTYLGPAPGPYATYYASQADSNPNQWLDLINLCDVLNNGQTGPALTQRLRPILDLDGTMWHLALNNVFVNMDSYQEWGNNFYVFHDDHHERMEVILHDLNMSFGTFNVGRGVNTSPTRNFNRSSLPLIQRTFQDSDLRLEYLAHVRTLADEVFDWTVLGPVAARYQALIDPHVQADPKKFYSYQAFVDSITVDQNADGYLVPGLAPLVTDRKAWLLSYSLIDVPVVDLRDLDHAPATPSPSDAVVVSVRVAGGVLPSRVALRWRLKGAFQEVEMRDDGLSGDGQAGDGVYAASIPPQTAASTVEYFVIAKEIGQQSCTFFPSKGERGARDYRVAAPNESRLLINEFVAKNDTGARDERGDFEDWIEIVNTDSVARDLGGMYLTDNLDIPNKWAFPTPTLLPPGGTLLVWADDDPGDGPYHATFKLGAMGEEIGLFATDGATLVDYFEFGPQLADVSTGRFRDGDSIWVTLNEPTPAASNDPSCGLRHYSALDPTRNPVALSIEGAAQQGQTITLKIDGGPPSGGALFFVGLEAAHFDLPIGGVSLMELNPTLNFFFVLDSVGGLSVPGTIPGDGSFLNLSVFFQAWCFSPTTGFVLTNGVRLEACP